jgi:hypothetical protein
MIEVSKIPSKEPEHSGNASLSLKDHEVNTLFGTDVSLAWMLWLSCLDVVALLLGLSRTTACRETLLLEAGLPFMRFLTEQQLLMVLMGSGTMKDTTS